MMDLVKTDSQVNLIFPWTPPPSDERDDEMKIFPGEMGSKVRDGE